MGSLEVILSVAVIVFLCALLFPVYTSTGAPAPRSQTLSNLKQVGLGVQMYLSDYDERLPFVEPFEFGNDPMTPYLKNESLYENIFLIRKGEKRLPNTTQHEFRFVFSPIALDNRIWKRGIIDLFKAENPSATQLAWSIASDGGSKFGIMFGDGHAQIKDIDKLVVKLSPGLLGRTDILGGRLDYILPDTQWPPPTWSVPMKDVLAYAEQAKKELAAQKPMASGK